MLWSAFADRAHDIQLMKNPSIRVKLIARGKASQAWARQSKNNSGLLNNCQFIFNLDETDYDWLVVIDDTSRQYRAQPTTLECADEHTLLVTSEPPTITRYGKSFCSQFAHVLTSQPQSELPHPRRIYSQTGNKWFNGHNFDELTTAPVPVKTKTLSTVCSSKQQKNTIHDDRYQFTQWLRQKIPAMDLFGRGENYVKHKYEALDAYKFHLAIENHIGLHHWTEKLSDPYLSNCIPIYYGCPNISDYFPKDSYIPIDIYKPEEALETIRRTIEDPDEYSKRYDALQQARNLVLYHYNLLTVLDRLIPQHFDPSRKIHNKRLYGRKQMRLRRPGDLFNYILWNTRK